mmetsp:Transcript_3754/g.5868  ORF Transcript_3754/g.5868 Transcript_3754/m.5868 type:complete len:257 (-) Transcript_3754:840-1610(-)
MIGRNNLGTESQSPDTPHLETTRRYTLAQTLRPMLPMKTGQCVLFVAITRTDQFNVTVQRYNPIRGRTKFTIVVPNKVTIAIDGGTARWLERCGRCGCGCRFNSQSLQNDIVQYQHVGFFPTRKEGCKFVQIVTDQMGWYGKFELKGTVRTIRLPIQIVHRQIQPFRGMVPIGQQHSYQRTVEFVPGRPAEGIGFARLFVVQFHLRVHPPGIFHRHTIHVHVPQKGSGRPRFTIPYLHGVARTAVTGAFGTHVGRT